MKLNHLSDDQLLIATERLVQQELTLLPLLLHHLQEIEQRRLFSALGYRSLFEYAVKKLRYADDQAYRRINAARMMKEIPQIESQIQSGALNLTHLGMANVVFKQEKLGLQTQIIILQKLEKTSSREAEKILRAMYPKSRKRDASRIVQAGVVEFRFSAAETLLEKIETVKGIFAHSHPNITNGDLFGLLCDRVIESRSIVAAPRLFSKRAAANRRALLAKGKCEKCGSTYSLEIDHRKPKALGGSDKPENLRLLCRSCNQRAAIEVFGLEKMRPYLT